MSKPGNNQVNRYKLTHNQRNERADDLIALLSGFDIPYLDSRTIASIMYQKLSAMSADEFLRKGADVNALVGALDHRDNETQSAEARQRIFHEPQSD